VVRVSPSDANRDRYQRARRQHAQQSLIRAVGDAVAALDRATRYAADAGEDLPDVVPHARGQLAAWHRALLERPRPTRGGYRPRRPGQGP
jgi:hypothetical protein